MGTTMSALHLFGLSAQCCLSKRTCSTKAGKFVICVKETQRSGCLVVIGTLVSPNCEWDSSHSIESSCQCSCFLCVPVAGCPLLGHRAAGQRVWSSCPGPVPLVWPDDGMVHKQMVMLGLSCALQRWHGDGTEVFRLAAPRQASPWTASLCNYHPSRRSCNSYSTSENVQQNTGQSSWQTAHRFYLKEDEHAFSKHISWRRYIAYAFNVKNNSKSRTKQIHEQRGKYSPGSYWRLSSYEPYS